MLGTTFGGNHLACAAAIAVLEVMDSEKLVENARAIGNYILNGLKEIPGLANVRGRGLMIGFDVEGNASEFRRKLIFDHHIFTGGAGEHTVRLLPPLTITREDADKLIKALNASVAE